MVSGLSYRMRVPPTDCPYQVQAPHTYSDSVKLVRDRLDFLSAEDREWLLRRTAETVFF